MTGTISGVLTAPFYVPLVIPHPWNSLEPPSAPTQLWQPCPSMQSPWATMQEWPSLLCNLIYVLFTAPYPVPSPWEPHHKSSPELPASSCSDNNPSVPIKYGTAHHEIQQHIKITGSHVHPNLSPPSSENLPTSHIPHFQHFLSPNCSLIALSRKQKDIPLTNQFCVCLKPTRPGNLLYLPQSLSPSAFPNENHHGHCLPDDPAWRALEYITYFVNLKIKGPLYLGLHSPVGSACPSPIH